jgi:hypothetical protein
MGGRRKIFRSRERLIDEGLLLPMRHGKEIGRENWLIPVDGILRAR